MVGASSKEPWTRGEDINTERAVLVRFRGKLWSEVTNAEGGACTTRWLRENSTISWLGTDRKPEGFVRAPVGRVAAPPPAQFATRL